MEMLTAWSRGRTVFFLGAILAAGLALRLWRLESQDAWHDEAFTITVSAGDFGPMTRAIVADFVHPPLHHYLLHFWFGLTGYGLWQARLLSAVFGGAAILMLYLLTLRVLRDRATALLAALLLAVSHLGVMYSQEARPYMQALFLVIVSVYTFARAVEERSRGWWWSFIVTATLAAYTHYYTALVPACLALWAARFHTRCRIPPAWWVTGAAASVALFAPWLASGVVGKALSSPKVTMAAQVPWAALRWWTPLTTLNWFNNGKLFGFEVQSPWWTLPLGAMLFTLPALYAVWRVQQQRDGEHAGAWLLLTLAAVPVVVVMSLGLLDVQYFVRYVMFCAAPYYVLTARGITRLPRPGWRLALVMSILLYSAPALRAHLTIPFKGEYRQGLAYLVSRYEPGDCCVSESRLRKGRLPLQWGVYHRGHADLLLVQSDDAVAEAAPCGRLWLVWSYSPWSAPDLPDYEIARRRLETVYTPVSERRFRGLFITEYTRARPVNRPEA